MISLIFNINGRADKLEEAMDFVASMKTYYGTLPITARECHDPAWKPLPISTAIGLPLVYRKDPRNTATGRTLASKQFTGPVYTHAGETNKTSELLALGIDNGSESCRKPTGSANCDVQFLREDRKDLTNEHIEAIGVFLIQCEKCMFSGDSSSTAGVAANSFVISPKTFFEYFKTIQCLEVEGNRAWAIPFPGKLDKPLCEGCYTNAQDSGKALTKCDK